MHACNEGTLLTWPLNRSQHDSLSGFFFSSHSISARALQVQSSPSSRSLTFFAPSNSSSVFFFFSPLHFSRTIFIYIQSTPFSFPLYLSVFFTFISLLLSPPVFPYAHWAKACLSVRVWIIEVYWVWSADGEMAVMDLSVLFRNRWVYADTCPVKARRSTGHRRGARLGTPQRRISCNGTCTCACTHMQVQMQKHT